MTYELEPHNEPLRKKRSRKNGNGLEKYTPPQTPVAEDFFERFTDIVDAYDARRRHYRELRSWSSYNLTLGSAKFLVSMFGGDIEADLEALWPNEDICRPSRKHIARRLSLMIGAFPNASPHSPEIYVRQMLSHVAGEHPSAMVLESACREIEASHKFLPAAAEMLTVLREQKEIWDKRLEVEVAVTGGIVQKLGDKLIAELTRAETDILARLDRDGYAAIAAEVRSGELSPKAALDQVDELERELEQYEREQKRLKYLESEEYQRDLKKWEAIGARNRERELSWEQLIQESEREAMLIRECLIDDPAHMQTLSQMWEK